MVMKKHGGDVMVDLLIQYGVDTVFGLPGGQTLALYYGICNRPGEIRHILMRDENNAVFAADAYARLTGTFGVCDGTAGCGPLKYASGLAEAYNSSIPIIAVASEQNSDWLAVKYRGCGPQQADMKNILAPVTKWQACLPTSEKMPELVQRAAQIAASGRPGPVYIECPWDLFDQEYSGGEYTADSTLASLPPYRPTPPTDTIASVLHLLKSARNPMLFAGGGTWLSGARDEITALAEQLDMPVVTSLSGKGILPENHPLSLGVMGSLGDNPVSRALVREADVIFTLGYKFSQIATYGWNVPAGNQKIIQLDIDGAEIAKLFPVELGMVGDVKATLQLLLKQLNFKKENPAIRKRIRSLKEEWQTQIALDAAERSPISPQQVVTILNEICDEDTILACDASFSCGWAGTYFDVYENRRTLFPRGMSGLGYGLPAGVGAAAAKPEKTIVVLTGDGGLSYCLGEMATMKEQNMNIKVIVLNNSILGWIKWYQSAIWPGQFTNVDTTHIDFAKVGEGMGCAGYHLTNPATLKEELSSILSLKGPAIVDIITSETDACKFTDRPEAVKRIEADVRRKQAAL